jgi:DNA-binding CsgD family transcriptional regulator
VIVNSEIKFDINSLTPTEKIIIKYISSGQSDKEISRMRSRSINTTRSHIKSIYQKMNVDNRTKAAMIYSMAVKLNPKNN